MLQTYEALLQPDGGLKFSELNPPLFNAAQKVLITVLPWVSVDVSSPAQKTETATWADFIGVLKDSTAFAGDPVTIQRKMRDEWR